jgi:hypothetical protein
VRRAVHVALWRGFWGKVSALVVALAAVAPASPTEVSGWLHSLIPWAPTWAVQAVGLSVLLTRLAMAGKVVAGSETEVERRRRG